MSCVRFEGATVEVEVANPELATSISREIRRAIADFALPPEYPVIHLRTFRRLEAVDVSGKIAIVRVTAPGLRRLPALIEAVRARALGVQLVWNGEEPPRDRAEATIFRVLETARATKGGPPVVLAASRRPTLALRALIRSRS